MEKKKLAYLLRMPRFPVLGEIDGLVIAARSGAQLQKLIAGLDLSGRGSLDFVDSTAEGWSLRPELMVVSPFTAHRRWTKRQVIEMFNRSRTAQQLGVAYSEKSLGSKRFDRILNEIVDLVDPPANARKAGKPR